MMWWAQVVLWTKTVCDDDFREGNMGSKQLKYLGYSNCSEGSSTFFTTHGGE